MRKLVPLIAVLVLLFQVPVHAQSGRVKKADPPKEQTKQQPPPENANPEVNNSGNLGPDGVEIDDDVLRFNTSLIMVPVSVVDRYGRYVPRLPKESFKIYEDGIEQKISYFGTTDQSMTVILLIDTSGSTSFRLEDIQDAAITFVSKLKPDDSVMVMSFDDRISVHTKPTSNRNEIERAIRKTRTGGGTRLYDAVDQIFNQHLRTITGRKAVVLFTDGVDTSSRKASYESTLRLADESEAPIYSVDYDTSGSNSVFTQGIPMPGGRGTILGIPIPSPGGGPQIPGSTPGEYRRAVAYLKALSNATGGRFYSGDTMFGIGQAFSWIAEELRRQYGIGYYPKTAGVNGQRRTIKVRVTEPELIVKARDSYIYSEKKPVTQSSEKTSTPEKPKPFISQTAHP